MWEYILQNRSSVLRSQVSGVHSKCVPEGPQRGPADAHDAGQLAL